MPYWVLGLLLAAGKLYGAILVEQGAPALSLEGVPIYPEAKLTVEGAPALPALKLTGAGVREKKVVLVSVDVYVAASYIDPAVTLDPAIPMEGFRRAKAKALKLTFLRDVDAEKIRDSFAGALKKNGADLKSPPVPRCSSAWTSR